MTSTCEFIESALLHSVSYRCISHSDWRRPEVSRLEFENWAPHVLAMRERSFCLVLTRLGPRAAERGWPFAQSLS